MRHRGLAALVAGAVVAGMAVLGTAANARQQPATQQAAALQQSALQQDFSVLVFSKTAGFRHDSIPDGIAAIQQLGAENGFTVDTTEDATQFTDENLAQYDGVIWLSTTGDVLNDTQQAAFERYIRSGGGYVGIHAAADTEYDWPWYGRLVGAYFDSHPAIQPATITVTDRVHPSTADLPLRWTRTDEWYNYRANPRPNVHVLAALDEDSYSGGTMGHDHPIAWCQDIDGGRSWYTGGGHTTESYSEPAFRQHVLHGILTAAGHEAADCGASVPANFDQVTLAKGDPESNTSPIGEPIALAVLPDGSVLTTARTGEIYHTAGPGDIELALDLGQTDDGIYSYREDGLQSIALDPAFATNRWVYVLYAPALDTPSGEVQQDAADQSFWDSWKGYDQLSRFRYDPATRSLDAASEQKILQIPQDRGNCCHHGADIDFDADGNLWMATGDDTDPFQSFGASPIDERTTRAPQLDGQRGAANTNDLRGKLLRITVQPDGSYAIPPGNLFPEAQDTQDKTRPEIYAMGFRNPFKFGIDDDNGVIYLGDYGPDAGSPNRYGPAGQVEFNRIPIDGSGAGFYGWPYCTGTNTVDETYVEREFTGDGNSGNDPIGAKFDCQNGPVNDSFRNTGLTQLPPAKPAWITYHDNTAQTLPELQEHSRDGSGSDSPMAGHVYDYDPNNPSPTKFPEYFDGKAFLGEWGRGWVKAATVAPDGSPVKIDPFVAGAGADPQDPNVELPTFLSREGWPRMHTVMDMEFGPNGSLYLLDYGTGFFAGDANSALYRIDYVKGRRSPVAEISADPTSGLAPLTVNFSAEGSSDPDPGDALSYAWDFDGDGTTDATGVTASHTYPANGRFEASVTVSDPAGNVGVASTEIIVGNQAPTLAFDTPGAGQIHDFGDTIGYQVTVTDPDGQPVDCSRVEVGYLLAHDEHSHGGDSVTGCEGSLPTVSAGHGPGENTFGIVRATYTDTPPSPGAPPITGTTELILQPRSKQAEHWTAMQGVQTVDDAGAEGGTRVGFVDNGDWLSFAPYNLGNVQSVTLRAASGGSGGNVEFHFGSPDGPLVAGPISVPNTGGYGNWQTFGPVPVTDPGGSGELFMVFKGSGGGLLDVDSFTLIGRGAADNARPVVTAAADPTDGGAPLTVQFTGTAEDPDGDELTYAWDFDGDGTTDSTELSPSHTYDEPGEYTATFTATDARGLSASDTVDVTVRRVLPPCNRPTPVIEPNDEFGGNQLNTCRWQTILRQDADHFRVTGGQLQIDALPGDMFAGTANARNIILQPTPRGSGWEAVTKVTFDSTDDFAQAGLMVHGDDRNWAKAMLINIPGQGWQYEFGQNVDSQAIFTDAYDRSGPLPADWPETSYLKVAYDGKGLTAAYSRDGTDWTTFGRVRSLHAIPDPQVGLAAFNGQGEPASFDFFHLTRKPLSPCTPTPPEEGYEPLFNGTEASLNKWVQAGPGGFVYANCELLSYGGLGLYWFDQEFQSYSLKLDWMMPGDDNSGVFVGSPRPGDDPWLAVTEGEEIQIDATDDPDSTTGAIYNEQAPDAAARDAALNPPGEWNTFEIVVQNDTITVFLNGVQINEWVDDDPNVDLDQGYIGIQNHGGGDDNYFRNIRIRELP